MEPQEIKVLKNVEAGLAEAFKDAAGDVGDTGDGGSVAGLDEAAAAEAGDAGAPPGLVLGERELVKAIRLLETGPRGLTEEGVVELARIVAKREAAHAHGRGHHHGFVRGLRHAHRGIGMPSTSGMRHEHDLVRDVPWRRSARMDAFRWDIIDRYKKHHGGRIDAGVGFYYGTLQVPMAVEGTAANPAFVLNVPPPNGGNLNPLIDTCFDYAIGDIEPNWFGGQHTLDSSDTNLQAPGAFLYPDQLMMVEAVSARLKAIRIQYYPPGTVTPPFPRVNPASMPITHQTLMGSAPTWDRGALILPPEFFNQYNDTCELAQAIAMVTTIYFAWGDHGLGGDDNLATKLVERMSAVPGAARNGVQETSGAGLHLDLPRAFVWCLDKQFQASEDAGGNGLFSAQLRQMSSFSFPFTPIPLYGSSGPALPTGCALEWQLTVHGTSLLPAKDRSGDRIPTRRRT